jgi:hypothetical protein
MNDIYLREVRLNDFRTFGDFRLDIPPGPGLTLLVGTNGLGKSSFFDGLEWCLTGTIRRFESYIGKAKERDYLTRRDATAGAHRVTLTFTEGEPVLRTETERPQVRRLLALLKQTDWTDIKDLAPYLAFTHFLGQASQQRFTSRGKNEQWEALKGPSGIDRLDAIRTALRGRSATNAFRRRVEREEFELTLAEKALAEWRKQAQRLAELSIRGAAAGAQSEATLSRRLSVLERQLPSNSARKHYAERLSDVRKRIETAQREVARALNELDSLRAIVERHATVERETDPEGTRAAISQGEVTAATTQLTKAALAATDAERASRDQALIITRGEAERDRLTRLRVAIAENALLEAERAELLDTERELAQEHAVRQEAMADARSSLDTALTAQRELAALDVHHETLLRWSERVTALATLEVAARARLDAVSAAEATVQLTRARLGELEQAAADARNAEEIGALRLSARRRDASELADLLSRIASHIGHDDEVCPLCASSFAPGELSERANAAIAAQDIRLAEETRAHEKVRDRHEVAASALNQARAEIAAAEVSVAEAEAAGRTAETERAAIANALDVDPSQDLARVVSARLGSVAQLRAGQMTVSAGNPAEIASMQSRVDALAATLGSLRNRINASAQRRAQCEAGLAVLAEALSEGAQPWRVEAIDEAIKDNARLLEAARAREVETRAAATTARNEEVLARQRLAVAETERDRVQYAIAEGKRALREIAANWQKANMPGAPSLDALAARENALITHRADLAEWLEEATALSRAYTAWLEQEEWRELVAAMEVKAGQGTANHVEYEQRLQEKLDMARSSLERTRAARTAVVAYAEQLKREAENFSTRFLLPLNDLIDAFNRALLSTPSESVQFQSAHTVERTSLAMRLRYSDPIENAQYPTELPPQLVLSEGQMAANGFSILCAASTAYRWSRWRALLLDDPLQHNDIIHAAAFVDVMRNLVDVEGYQLLMSSHKRDEGEFIARKFDAASLPCTVVELIATSKDGVRLAPPRHNAAARRLLARVEASVA